MTVSGWKDGNVIEGSLAINRFVVYAYAKTIAKRRKSESGCKAVENGRRLCMMCCLSLCSGWKDTNGNTEEEVRHC